MSSVNKHLCRLRPKRRLCSPSFLRPSSLPRTYATTALDKHTYDIVIVGGGLVGSALACALAASPVTRYQRIAVIDATDLSKTETWTPPTDANVYSNRASSLTSNSLNFLKEIGAWNLVDVSRVQPYHDMKVWDALGPGLISFSSSLVKGRPEIEPDTAIAWMAENVNVHSALLRQLRESSETVDVLDKTRVEKIYTAKDTLPKPKLIVTDKDAAKSIDEGRTDAVHCDWPIVRLEGGKEIRARLLVGADGMNSPVRSHADIESIGWDYDQHGLVATLDLANSPIILKDNMPKFQSWDQAVAEAEKPSVSPESVEIKTAYQRFLPTGPIALLPLPNNTASLVWSLPPQIAKRLQKLNPSDFVHLVNAAFSASVADMDYWTSQITESGSVEPGVNFAEETAWRADVRAKHRRARGGVGSRCRYTDSDGYVGGEESTIGVPMVSGVQEGTRASFPLRLRNAERYVANRVALVGDAAHSMHPLAGQGLNQGFADVRSLSRTIEKGILNGQDIGSIHLLTGYSSARYFPNLAMAGAIDKLSKLFSVTWRPIVWARSLGLEMTNWMTPLKSEIMMVAMGGYLGVKKEESMGTKSGR